jgi:inorganic pyrophosphatase
MSFIKDKKEKIVATINSLTADYSDIEFIEKFKELYPNDVKKIEANYRKHQRKTKPGGNHPMPSPDQYMRNMLNIFRNKIKIA